MGKAGMVHVKVDLSCSGKGFLPGALVEEGDVKVEVFRRRPRRPRWLRYRHQLGF